MCVWKRTNIPCSNITWLSCDCKDSFDGAKAKEKNDFAQILLGAKYFIQSVGDSCLLANRTMTVLWRHMQV